MRRRGAFAVQVTNAVLALSEGAADCSRVPWKLRSERNAGSFNVRVYAGMPRHPHAALFLSCFMRCGLDGERTGLYFFGCPSLWRSFLLFFSCTFLALAAHTLDHITRFHFGGVFLDAGSLVMRL